MNWERVEDNWKDFQGKVLQQWSKLTKDDFNQVKGRRDALLENFRSATTSPGKPPNNKSRTGCVL